jgi:hypothetical protein
MSATLLSQVNVFTPKPVKCRVRRTAPNTLGGKTRVSIIRKLMEGRKKAKISEGRTIPVPFLLLKSYITHYPGAEHGSSW